MAGPPDDPSGATPLQDPPANLHHQTVNARPGSKANTTRQLDQGAGHLSISNCHLDPAIAAGKGNNESGAYHPRQVSTDQELCDHPRVRDRDAEDHGRNPSRRTDAPAHKPLRRLLAARQHAHAGGDAQRDNEETQ